MLFHSFFSSSFAGENQHMRAAHSDDAAPKLEDPFSQTASGAEAQERSSS